MRIRLSSILVVVLTFSSFNSISSQTASQQQQRRDEPALRIRANEVTLDIVVRDKKGRPVKDLTAPDFEVYEDGIRQQIGSFRFVLRQPTEGANTTAGTKNGKEVAAPRVEAPRDVASAGVIALVFDRLSPEARALARKAGLAYADEGITGGGFTGVFGIDQALRTIQSYTDNPELIRQAVERATSTTTSTYASGAGKVRDLSDKNTALSQEISSGESAASAAGAARDAAGASAAGATIGQAAAQQALNEMETRIIENFEALERDQQGFATINSLLAVITPMRNLPGRKTIIFFSEGLSLPESVQTKFPSVINAANRANVSIYAIDSAGLRIESGAAEAAREINSLASRRMQQAAKGTDSIQSAPYTKALERNEDLLRLDPRSGLGQLADQTGGFLIHDTNDLKAGLRRIDDDMRAYYVLTYIPKNEDYNGQFRHIAVKLNRQNLEAQTRKGYYAVESVGELPMLDYEAPAIAASHNARPNSITSSFRAAALDFPATGRPGLAVILGEAPISAFTLSPASDKKTYNADFSIIALVRDQSGQVVQKLSQHYPLSGPIEKLQAAKKGDVLFYREVQLPPGRYTVELIAYDASLRKADVRKTSLEVARVDEGKLRLSSVVVLSRAERITADEQKKDQPFYFGELVVYPNLGEPILKSVTKQLAYFLTAWPAKGAVEPLKLVAEIVQNRHSIAQTSAQLPAADDQGRIKYAGALPLDGFQPGAYELKVTVTDNRTSISRSTQFKIEP
jgi:VWFA-related protein